MRNIKMTDSVSFERPVSRPHTEQKENSEAAISAANASGRQRVPAFLMTALRGLAEGAILQGLQGTSIKRSKVGQMMRSGLKSAVHKLKDISSCEICEGEVVRTKQPSRESFMCDCQHKFNFCQSCLHHYVIYKVRNFEEVHCPREGCPAVLDVGTNFFRNLPADIQRNYRKIRQFQLVSQDPNVKLCPAEKCEGVIRASGEGVMACDSCMRQFCGKCLLSAHQGDCNRQQVDFFEKNLHYRQCKKCKVVVEKNQGCNHITCRCKYQFCYVCGAPWTSAHYGNHDEQGNLVPVPEFNNNVNPEPECCDNCCACDCCNACFGDCCSSLLKAPIKALLFVLLVVVMALLFMCRDFFVWVVLVCLAVFAGMTGFTVEIISEQEGLLCILAVLFLPVTMIFGIVRGFREIFVETIGELCSDFTRLFTDGIDAICEL